MIGGPALPGGPAGLWHAINNESRAAVSLTGEGFHVGYDQGMGRGLFGVPVAGHYFVKFGLSEVQEKAVALGIFKEVSNNFENLQANWPFSWITNSGNSEEDRPSNLIAFYRAVEGFSRNQIEGFCGVRSKEESKCLWDKIGGLKSSTSWSPTDYNSVLNEIVENETISALQWPSELNSINEAAKGENWRNWNYSTDQ